MSFWQLVLRASRKARSFGFPLTVFVILLVWCLLHHRLSAPHTETHYPFGFALPASPFRLLFKLNVVCTYDTILLVCVRSFKKRSTADAEFIHRVHRLSVWLPDCAVQSTGSASFPSTVHCWLRSGTHPPPLQASICASGSVRCKSTSPALTSLFDDERRHVPAGSPAQADTLGNPNVPIRCIKCAIGFL